MSGHNKWSKIKRQKGIEDAKRGQIYTKLTREIMAAAREGGGDMESNFKLRLAVQKARDQSMPLDNIQRAVKRGSGELGGAIMQELMLEGYGASGSAILVQTLSDNRNRSVQEVRNIFTRHGGTMASAGAVSWKFDSKGIITLEAEDKDPSEIELQAIEAGADDIKIDGKSIEIYTKPNELELVRKALEAKNIKADSSELAMIPKVMAEVDEKGAVQTLKLLDKLEELDDVQKVYSDVDFSEEIVEKYQSGAYA